MMELTSQLATRQLFLSLNENLEVIYMNDDSRHVLTRDLPDMNHIHIVDILPDFKETPFYKKLITAITQSSHLEFQDYYPSLHKWFELRVYPGTYGINICLIEITEQIQKENMLAKKRLILEMIAKGKPIQDILHQIILSSEQLSNQAICSLLLLDKSERYLHIGAAPSLPESFNNAVEGLEIGPAVGSCGTAAYLKKKVVVTDISTDPLWSFDKDIALAHGLQSCWSTPIFSSTNKVLGTFAMYYTEKKQPSQFDLEINEFSTYLASIAIEQHINHETRIEETESKYQLIAENTSDVIKILDTKFIIKYISPSIKTVLGYAQDAWINNLSLDYIHPDDIGKCIQTCYQVLREKEQQKIEYRTLHVNGNWIDFEAILTPILDDNKVTSVLVVSRDITDRKKWERQVNESEQRLKSLFEHNPDAVFSFDLTGRFTSLNDATVQLSGYSTEELLNMTYHPLIEHANIAKANILFQKAVGGEKQTYELTIVTKQLKTVDLIVTNVPIIIDDKIVGVYGIAKNITEQKKARHEVEMERQKSEDKFRRLIDEFPEAVVILGGNRLLFINNKVVGMFGAKSKEQLMKKRVSDFVDPEYHYLYRIIKNSIKECEKISNLHVKCITLNREILDVEITAMPILFEGEQAIQVVMRDITELKRSKELLQDAENLSAAGELAAGIAHEIRNPLTSIKGFIQLAQTMNTNLERYYPIILTEIDRINTIISELLLLAKPKVMDYRKSEITSIIYDVLNLFNPQAILHNIEINTDIVIDEAIVRCHESQLKQVIINLLKNSLEAMPTGGKINVGLTETSRTLCLTIKDEGRGIPKDILPKLGKPFFTTKDNGTGLGLATCFSIIENHKGIMNIESEENLGTTITIKLPKT